MNYLEAVITTSRGGYCLLHGYSNQPKSIEATQCKQGRTVHIWFYGINEVLMILPLVHQRNGEFTQRRVKYYIPYTIRTGPTIL
jgi:hypothetical protein